MACGIITNLAWHVCNDFARLFRERYGAVLVHVPFTTSCVLTVVFTWYFIAQTLEKTCQVFCQISVGLARVPFLAGNRGRSRGGAVAPAELADTQVRRLFAMPRVFSRLERQNGT